MSNDVVNAKFRLRYATNAQYRKKKLKAMAAWKARNPELQRLHKRRFIQKNREYNKAQCRKWYRANREYNNLRCRLWREANRAKVAEYERARRVRQAGE